MQAVGLTLKWANKKYSGQGELMLVHLCEQCGQVSLNRIARDDDIAKMHAVLEQSASLSDETQDLLAQQGVTLLDSAQSHLVR
jgi:hypothetical protein